MAQTMQPTLQRAYARMPDAFPVEPGTRPFSARATYNKVGALVCVAVLAAMAGWVIDSTGLSVVCILVAFAAAIVGIFKPAFAHITAPVYAVCEGVALGWISSAYSTLGRGVIPLSVTFTAIVFVVALAAFRTGLVRVTRKFWTVTIMATGGLAVVYLLSMLGMPIPGANDVGTKGAIFGVIGLVVAVLNLFVDFQFIDVLESGAVLPGRRGQALMSSQGEWYAAQMLMMSLVLVYLNVLRIVGAAAGGGGRR